MLTSREKESSDDWLVLPLFLHSFFKSLQSRRLSLTSVANMLKAKMQ